MADIQDTTSLTALVVSLFALVVALGQLLQQIYTTADGYRKCQASVIGGWSNRTRLKWRWSEFRFETRFTTPNFTLDFGPTDSISLASFPAIKNVEPPHDHGQHRFAFSRAITSQSLFISGWPISRTLSLVYKSQDPGEAVVDRDYEADAAGWLRLLNSLHCSQRETMFLPRDVSWMVQERFLSPAHGDIDGEIKQLELDLLGDSETQARRTIPTISIKERSWDFVSAEIARPLAQANVGDLVVLAHRLGMRWRDLDPAKGKMRAEGNGHSMTSSMVRGYGIVVQYNFDKRGWAGQEVKSRDTIMIPSLESDKLLCGIIPGCRSLKIEDMPLTLNGDDATLLTDILVSLDIQQHERDQLVASRFDDRCIIWEMLGMVCPFMPLRSSPIVQIVQPMRFAGTRHTFSFREGRIIYAYRFQEFLRNTQQESKSLSDLLARLSELWSKFDFEWNYNSDRILKEHSWNKPKRRFLELVRICFDLTNENLREYHKLGEEELGQTKPGNAVLRLVGAYLTANVDSAETAARVISNGPPRDPNDIVRHPRADGMMERAHLHVDKIDTVVAIMKRHGYRDESRTREACWCLIFRGVLWYHSVLFIKDYFPQVPSYFYGSLTPVYIS